VRLPTNVQALYIRACRFKADFYNEHGRQAFDEEVAKGLEISTQRLKDVWNAHNAVVSMDATANADDEPLANLLAVCDCTLHHEGPVWTLPLTLALQETAL
jgi:DNA-directed RNA polymerase specialized sigma subunit